MSATDPVLIMRGARKAAWRVTPEIFASWREDVAQEVALEVLSLHQRFGRWAGAASYKWAAFHAVRRMLFLSRGQDSQDKHPREFEGSVEAPDELAPIALWRLQKHWAGLTAHQRVALFQLISGDRASDVAVREGMSHPSLCRARKSALARLDKPKRAEVSP